MDLVLYPLIYPRFAGLVQCLQLHSPDSLDNCGLSVVPLIINPNMKSKHISSHSTDCIIILLAQIQTLCAWLLQRTMQLNVQLLNSLFTVNKNGSDSKPFFKLKVLAFTVLFNGKKRNFFAFSEKKKTVL